LIGLAVPPELRKNDPEKKSEEHLVKMCPNEISPALQKNYWDFPILHIQSVQEKSPFVLVWPVYNQK